MCKDLIIFSGQSNMQGQTERPSELGVIDGAFEYKWLDDELVPLSDPVGENITYSFGDGYEFSNSVDVVGWLKAHVTGSSCYGYASLVPGFCKKYVELTGRQVIAAHIAKGSTTVAEWLPGRPGYEILVRKARAAAQKVKAEHIFFVWLQGESDAVFGLKKAEYKRSMIRMAEALSHDAGVEKLGIIRVGRFAGDKRDDEIIDAQEELCRERKEFVMLTDVTAELESRAECMNPNVAGHFGTLGLEIIGRKSAETMAKFV